MKRLLAALAVLLPMMAHAGSPCTPAKRDGATFARAMDLALATRKALDDSGAQVALIARAGQDLDKYGLRYSHMGFAWRDHPKGRWLVVHELNQCGTARSALFNEGLGNFFLDDMARYQTLIVIPNAAAQARLAAALASGLPLALHTPNYNMLSYAFSTQYQNSNQWLLEVYAASAGQAVPATRHGAHAWMRQQGYQPITVDLPATTRLGARLFRANVAFDDHPFGRRMAGQIDTVSADSVARFVRQRDPAASALEIALP